MYTFHIGDYLPKQQTPHEREVTPPQSSSGMTALKQRLFSFEGGGGGGVAYTTICQPAIS